MTRATGWIRLLLYYFVNACTTFMSSSNTSLMGGAGMIEYHQQSELCCVYVCVCVCVCVRVCM